MGDSLSIDKCDYYDFGCSDGTNIAYINSIWPMLRGVGIDIDPAKVEIARSRGHDAHVFDILKLPGRKQVEFVAMSHFLEHLHGVAEAAKMIKKSIAVSRQFVFIRQPWFDSDGDLMQLGLKFYWSHWRGHRNKMTSLDFYSILNDERLAGRIHGFSLYGRGKVCNSHHPALIPLECPADQHAYDARLHGEKQPFDLPFVAFKEILVRIDIGNGEVDGIGADAILHSLNPQKVLCRA
jgi:hypothetical protein